MASRSPAAGGEAGFTLVEVLITLTIMAVVTGSALMVLGDGRSRSADASVARLGLRLQYALDDALMRDRRIALILNSATGYRFVVWDVGSQSWTEDVDPQLASDGRGDAHLQIAGLGPAGSLLLLPEGESNRFTLILSEYGRNWRISSDGLNVSVGPAYEP